MQKFTTFLLFVGDQCGKAEEAMDFYVSLFGDSKIDRIERYGAGGMEREGTVKYAEFTLSGQKFMAIDSALDHKFTFTPAMSTFVHCETEKEIDELFEKLSHGGKVHMPLDKYPFSQKFTWVEDKYGVSWQLNLA